MPLSDLVLQEPASAPQSTEDYIKHFRQMNPGSEDAFHAAMIARHEADQGKTGAQRDLNLRNAEHALFTQTMLDQQGPVAGRAMMGLLVPGYAAAKGLAQAHPAGAGAVKLITGQDYRNSTPPDLSELYWGLRPLFRSLK